ncbi:MAG: HU family DNA-binding protein [Clostridia bacterium]|nr:HU family DNA-binding protein [Clostridia bacterium]
MNKAELITDAAERAYMSKKCITKVLSAMISTTTEALADGKKVKLVDLGTFEVRKREEKTGRNPSTGEKITLPSTKVPFFRAGKVLKEEINKR